MTRKARPFPLAPEAFDRSNEEVFRRALEQEIQDVYNTIQRAADGIDATASLALRRHQFLLMGAPRG